MSNRWVKYPGPGEFRGEGEWVPVESIKFLDTTVDEGWQYLKQTGYLPTWEVPEGVNPNDATNYLPTYVGEKPNA